MNQKNLFFYGSRWGIFILLMFWVGIVSLRSSVKADYDESADRKQQKESILLEENNPIAETLEREERHSIEEDSQQKEFLEKMNQSIDDAEEQLAVYQEAMEQMKDLLGIVNTGSLESQLDEIFAKVQQTLVYLDDLKNEIERQLEGDYDTIPTEGMSQVEAIFAKITALKRYGNNLKQFHDVIQGLLGLDSASTEKEIYQVLSQIKDQIVEYGHFLDQTEELLHPDGVKGSSSLVTGEQTREELNQVYTKIEEIVTQLNLFKETLQVFLEKEEISVEDAKEWYEQVIHQKEQAERFLSELKNLLGMDNHAEYSDILQAVTNMKETLSEYWNYLGDVEELIRIPDGSGIDSSDLVTGSAVTVRLSNLYDKLTDMVAQQDDMANTINRLLNREEILTDTVEELNELLNEIEEQRRQADRFLEELKNLLGLEDQAEYRDVLDTVSNMKNKLNVAMDLMNALMKQLGITFEGEGEDDFSHQLNFVLNQVMDKMNQLAEEIRKSEEADQEIALLKQKLETLAAEKEQAIQENGKLKKEIEELKKTLSSGSCDDSERKELERKNQLQQEQIIKLEQEIFSQAEEIERLTWEQEQLLHAISDKNRQMEELKGQMELLTIQLVEKEEKIAELERQLEKQNPSISVVETETIIIQSNSMSEEILIQEESEHKETVATIDSEIEKPSEAMTEQAEETSVLDQNELTTETETEEAQTTMQEESQEKSESCNMIPILLFIAVLILAGTAILIFKSRKKTEE